MKTLEQLGISPAPWRYQKSDCFAFYWIFSGASNRVGSTICSETAEADARLMHAATELYEACLKAYDLISDSFRDSYIECAEDLRSALAKAGGETEPNEWCKHDPTRKCVDCEICGDIGETEGETK